MRPLSLQLALAVRNTLRQKRRSGIAIGAVAFGIAALILAGGFIEWIFFDMRESTIKAQLGHIQIVRQGYHDSGKASPFEYLLPQALPQLDTPAAAREVKTVAPRLAFSGLVSRGDSTVSFIGEGVSPQAEASFAEGLQIRAGENLSEADPKAVIMGEGLARSVGAQVGDKVVLLASTASGGTNAVEVTVRGLFSTITKLFDDSALRIPLATAQTLLRTDGTHMQVVLLHDTARTDAVLAKLREKLPPKQLEAVAWYQLADIYNQTAELFTKQVHGVRMIIALIIILCISNTMATNVMERIGEIGTSMALGIKRSGILQLFLCEGIVLGTIGGIVGIVIGALLAAAISAVGIPMPPAPGMAHGFTGRILVTWETAGISLLLAVATTLLASILPAWKASRLEIVNALRHNR